MPSSTLHNPQQEKQKPVSNPIGKGSGTVRNSSLGSGSGKVVNGTPPTVKKGK